MDYSRKPAISSLVPPIDPFIQRERERKAIAEESRLIPGAQALGDIDHLLDPSLRHARDILASIEARQSAIQKGLLVALGLN